MWQLRDERGYPQKKKGKREDNINIGGYHFHSKKD
jgi:hypothetical protein